VPEVSNRYQLEEHPETAALTEGWQNALRGVIDSLQLELDTRRLFSEVHLVLRKL